jgi:cell cycle checkpoint control protein RAD9A
LKKPLQTSIAVETDEFDEIDVEDKLHVVISVKDFRAIIQHAGIIGNNLSARYSLPFLPIQLSYSSDAISCEFLVMTFGERGTNPAQKTKKGQKNGTAHSAAPRLEATSRRASEAPQETNRTHVPMNNESNRLAASRQIPPNPTPQLSAARASVSRLSAFDLRPSQRPPPPTLRSESLFVDDDGWDPPEEEGDEDENARLEWDHSANPVSKDEYLHQLTVC